MGVLGLVVLDLGLLDVGSIDVIALDAGFIDVKYQGCQFFNLRVKCGGPTASSRGSPHYMQ